MNPSSDQPKTPDSKPTASAEAKPEVKDDPKTDAKPTATASKPDAKTDAKPDAKPDPKTGGKPEAKPAPTPPPNPDDPAKTLALFQPGPARVPRETFLAAAAQLLYDESPVFNTSQLDQPQRLKAMYEQALAALGQVPETKETKALVTKIQALMKKMPLV